MLTLNNVSVTRGVKTLIENLTFSVFAKQHLGIVGANGSGKSSLLSIILEQLEPSAGEIERKNQLRLSSVEQEITDLDFTALQYVLSGNKSLYAILSKLWAAEAINDYSAVVDCHGELQECDGYRAESQASKILVGLGFENNQLTKKVREFSGGWQMRLNLAKCLFSPSELLLLDEPTNHLDMEAIIWLQSYIKKYPGGIILVTHDQDFLDGTTTHILHIEHQQGKVYKGNYSAFAVEHANQLALQQAQYTKQQAKLSHMMKFVDKFRYKASKAKQAQSRLKAINKLELLQPLYAASPFTFQFQQPDRMPTPMLRLNKVSLGYGDVEILKNINLIVTPAQRIGLLGLNGAGKSTLIKGICGELPPQSGEVIRPSGLHIGYFAQHQLESLPMDESPLEYLGRIHKDKSEKQLTSYLGGFKFNRDQALSSIKTYSGGEKARVALAAIILTKPNLLLLDEPTNHLDMDMRQALMLALQQYEGAMVLVSHDRHLMRSLVDELYLIENHRVSEFDGGLEEYEMIYG